MSQDSLFESLVRAAASRSIAEEELRHMLEDEVRALSSGARVHDYIRVFAIRHLRERMLSDDDGSSGAPPGYFPVQSAHHARNGL